MALRKFLFFDASEGFSTEQATTDELDLGKLTLSGVSGVAIDAGGARVTGLGSPTSATDAVTKSYADALSAGLTTKAAVRVLSIANQTLSGLPTIDGVTLADGERVLLTGQTTASQNGIWAVHAGAWIRPSDFAAGSHSAGAYMFVLEGTNFHDEGWICITDAPNDVVDTDSLAFTQFTGLGDVTAGAGLTKGGGSGNVLDIGKGEGINVRADDIAVDLSATPGLEFDVTGAAGKLQAKVDPNGGIDRVTAGLKAKLNGTTLQSGSSGLSVKGLPPQFEINGVAVSANFTAANASTLVDGGNADALHSHVAAVATEAPKVENTLAVDEAVAVADPLYITATGSRAGKARADTDAKAKVIALARTAQSTVGNTTEAVTAGPAVSVLTGATPGAAYYLQATGGIGTALPAGGNRVIQVGVALTATDLFVRIVDYGKKAA